MHACVCVILSLFVVVVGCSCSCRGCSGCEGGGSAGGIFVCVHVCVRLCGVHVLDDAWIHACEEWENWWFLKPNGKLLCAENWHVQRCGRKRVSACSCTHTQLHTHTCTHPHVHARTHTRTWTWHKVYRMHYFLDENHFYVRTIPGTLATTWEEIRFRCVCVCVCVRVCVLGGEGERGEGKVVFCLW